jgi:hypothetical protein
MVRLLVINPFLALQNKDNKSAFYTLPVGSIIATGDDLWQPGLVHISLRGQDLLAFARDIKEHTETLDLGLATDNGAEGETERDSLENRHAGKHPFGGGP